MRKFYIQLCLVLGLGISVGLTAQTDPGTANLKHQWTFDDGTANDKVGTAHGTLEGAATISGKALSTLTGGYMSFPGATIAINTYSEVTIETWFTSSAGQNGGCNMLSYFGETVGTVGANYIFSTPAGCSGTRMAISTGNTSQPWTVETGINSPSGRIDDGNVHQLITIIDATSMYFYVDGLLVGSTALTGTNSISAVSAANAYLCKGGYTGDPTWKGLVNKHSIYNKALSADEVLYLYMAGAEASATISATAGAIALDENYPSVSFSVSSANLSSDIIVTAPAGITMSPTTITKNTNNVLVSATYTGTDPVDGKVKFTSGSNELEIPVKTVSDAACYVPLYSDQANIVLDPGANNMSMFAGWGAKEAVNVITTPGDVYCGGSSIKVGNGSNSCSGSVDFVLTGLLLPNTSYRVKAMVRTVDGSFQVGLWGYDSTKGDLNNPINTDGAWQALDFVFTTGATLGGTQGMFFNNCGSCTGKTGYIDNWEMYIYQEPLVTVSKTSMAFDPEYRNTDLIVAGTNLTADIAVSTLSGLLVNPATVPFNAVDNTAKDTLDVTFDGATAINGDLVVSSGSASKTIKVKSTLVSNTTCFNPLFTDKTNLIPDPYLNNPAKFGGWGGKEFVSIATEPDSVYCGSHSGRVVGSGSLDVVLAGIVKKNTSYVARAMVRSIGEFQIGVGGIDVTGANADKTKTFNTNGNWEPLVFEFTTGDSLRVNNQPLFINNWQLSGTRCYVDNYELYEGTFTSVKNATTEISNVYVENGQLVAVFNAATSAKVQIDIYSMQGKLMKSEVFTPSTGRNTKVINATLATGAYVVKMTQNGLSNYKKLIK